MQVRAADLGRHLERGVGPLYTIFGDEPLLVLEAADRVREAARRAGCDERDVFVVEPGFDWGALLAASQNLSLFGERRIVELRLPTGKPGQQGGLALVRYTEVLSRDNVTIVTLPRLDKATQGSAWFTALDGAGVCIPVYPLERAEMPAWLAARLARQNQRAAPAVLEFLADRTEGNLLAALQEVVKLGLVLPEGALELASVEQAVADVARFDVGDLSLAWLRGDAARLVRILEALRAEGDTLQLVLWQLGEDLHILAALAAAAAMGTPASQAVRRFRAWGARASALEGASPRLSYTTISALIRELAHLDSVSKGLGREDAWIVAERMALTLAGKRPGSRPALLPRRGSTN